MYEVVKVMTNDGHLFDNAKEAKEYLEVEYTDKVSRLASKLVSIEKYQDMKEYLNDEDNLEKFVDVLALHNELKAGVRELED